MPAESIFVAENIAVAALIFLATLATVFGILFVRSLDRN
jgi:UPF0716 family protein affecting phage T7 exclusion